MSEGLHSEKPYMFTDQTFQSEVIEADGLVLVDFWASWCGPCRMIGPVVAELARAYEGKVKIGKLNVDENPQTAHVYGVRSIPTLIFFRDGKVVDTLIGAVPRHQLETRLNRLLEQVEA